MSDANVEVKVSVNPESKGNLEGLKKDFKGVSEAMQGVGESGEHVKRAGEHVKKLGEHGHEATGGVAHLLESMGELKEMAEKLVTSFLALEVIKKFMEMGREAAASEDVARNLQVIGNNAGYAAEKLEETVKALHDMGASAEGAEKGLTTMLTAGLTPEKAEKLGEAAKKIALSKGQNIDQVFQRMGNALVRGSALMLSMGQDALFNHNDFDQRKINQQRPGDRANTLADQMIRASSRYDQAGDGGATARIDRYDNLMSDVGKNLGTVVLPAYKELYDYLVKGAKAFSNWSEELSKNKEVIDTVGQSVRVFTTSLQLLKDVAGTAEDVLSALGGIVQTVFGGLASVVSADGKVVTGAELLSRALKGIALALLAISTVVQEVGLAITTVVDLSGEGFLLLRTYIAGFFGDFVMAMSNTWDQLGLFFKAVKEGIKDTFDTSKTWDEVGKNWDAHLKEMTAAETRYKAGQKAAASAAETDRRSHLQKMYAISIEAAAKLQGIEDKQGTAQDNILNGKYGNNPLSDNPNPNPTKYKGENPDGRAQEKAREAAEREMWSYITNFQNEQLKEREEQEKNAYSLGRTTLKEYLGQQLIDLDAAQAIKKKKTDEDVRILKEGLTKQADLTVSQRMQINNEVQSLLDKQSIFDMQYQAKRVQLERDANVQLYKEAKKFADQKEAFFKAAFALEKSQLDAKSANGQMTDIEKMDAENALLQKQIDHTKELIQVQSQALGENAGSMTPEQINSASQGIITLQDQLVQLQATYKSLGDTVRNDFANSLESAFDRLLARQERFRVALRSFLAEWTMSMAKIAAKNASQSLTRSLDQATGANANGEGGLFGTLGGILGGGTKPSGAAGSPLHVVMDPLTGVFGGADNELKSVFGNLGSGLNSFTTMLGQAFRGLFNGTGGGASGFLGSLGSFFSGNSGSGVGSTGTLGGTAYDPVAMMAADGGLLSGPKHTQGGIPIEAEGGEYIISAKQTARFLPLLHAINNGALNMGNIHTPVPKFGQGGLVDPGSASSAGSMQTNHISIAIDGQGNASASGTGSRNSEAFSRQLSGMISQELIKQRRPGGLLAA